MEFDLKKAVKQLKDNGFEAKKSGDRTILISNLRNGVNEELFFSIYSKDVCTTLTRNDEEIGGRNCSDLDEYIALG